LEELIEFSKRLNSLAVVGTPYYDGDLYNSLVLIGRGELLGVYHKTFLPNYSVFDEKRYFRKGEKPFMVSLNGVKLGFSVCEDIWHPDGWERFYALCGTEVLININASPYYVGKYQFKESFLKARAQDNLAYVVYANLVGGQDDLVFDGRSLIIDPEGRLIFRASAFKEMVKTVSLPLEKVKSKRLMDLRLREKRIDCPSFLELQDERAIPYLEGEVERELAEGRGDIQGFGAWLEGLLFQSGF
jgi:NAD+ synthase (glutamine-hydrolysing)